MKSLNTEHAAANQSKVNAPVPALPETGFARVPVVAQAMGVKVPTIWLWVRNGKFPRPVKISERVTGWRAEEVREFMADPQAWKANRNASA